LPPEKREVFFERIAARLRLVGTSWVFRMRIGFTSGTRWSVRRAEPDGRQTRAGRDEQTDYGRACSRAAAETPLFGLVMVLQRNHQSLHRPQWPQRDNEDQGQPKRRVDPIRRLKQDLRHQRSTDHDCAGET